MPDSVDEPEVTGKVVGKCMGPHTSSIRSQNVISQKPNVSGVASYAGAYASASVLLFTDRNQVKALGGLCATHAFAK